jgi:hypothetical protein
MIPYPTIRTAVAVAAIMILSFSFSIGKINAQNVLSGKNARIISTQLFKEIGTDLVKSKGILEGQENLKYVGAAGDYFFFLTLDNSTMYAVKYSDLHFLELRNLQ